MDRPIVQDVSQVIDKIEPVMSLTASRNMETVKRVIKNRYGIDVTDAFAQDLIDFVEALTDGQ